MLIVGLFFGIYFVHLFVKNKLLLRFFLSHQIYLENNNDSLDMQNMLSKSQTQIGNKGQLGINKNKSVH